MTQELWDSMSPEQRAAARDLSGLSPQLTGLEGWRVEVVTATEVAEKRRFIVGRSTGWRPCHIELSRRNAQGGPCADQRYASVRKLYKVYEVNERY